MELKHQGVPISVTDVRPASINTPFFNKARTKLGVKPMGMPPFYEPEVLADAIVYAAEHPTREIIAGGAGKLMISLQKLAPQLFDTLMERSGFAGQRTSEPKAETAPTNMFAPIDGYNHVTLPNR